MEMKWLDAPSRVAGYLFDCHFTYIRTKCIMVNHNFSTCALCSFQCPLSPRCFVPFTTPPPLSFLISSVVRSVSLQRWQTGHTSRPDYSGAHNCVINWFFCSVDFFLFMEFSRCYEYNILCVLICFQLCAVHLKTSPRVFHSSVLGEASCKFDIFLYTIDILLNMCILNIW